MTATLTSGCDPDTLADDADGVVHFRPGGGVWLNTSSIGAQPFSEFDTSGIVHDGVRFTGLLLKRADNTWLAATPEVTDGNLKGKVGKTAYVGVDLVGSRWKFNMVDGAVETPVEIWIESYTQVSPKEARYTFKTLDSNGVAQPICDADLNGSVAVTPIRDITVDSATGDMVSRTKTVYLACTSGALGKAIAWGYRPWERPLQEFEAATRMVRADYCYDGMSWTETGISLQVHDKYGVNTFLDATDPNEAVWLATGAACIGTPRNPTYGPATVTCNGQALPSCPANVGMSTYAGSLFWTKRNVP
ncbi:MAG TPA: ADYC domain-containing protein [Nannocystis sp.]